MKIILLFSSHSHSVANIFNQSLLSLGHEVKMIDPDANQFKKNSIILGIKVANRIGLSKVKTNLLHKIVIEKNEYVLSEVDKFQPDITISYNDSFLFPATVEKIKLISKFILFLGDNPFYSFFKNHFLQIVQEADLVITPDTGCQEQLIASGINNVIYGILGIDNLSFRKIIPTESDILKYGNDVFYLGNMYAWESWALKRALFLQNFTNHDFRIFGNKSWNKILPLFPDLNKHFQLLAVPMDTEELNLRMNCSKIYPVDAHPGIINGLHARIFDAISAQTLPIIEYRADLEKIFTEVKPPSFRNFKEARELTTYYITHDSQRENLVKELNQFLIENYSSQKCVNQIISSI